MEIRAPRVARAPHPLEKKKKEEKEGEKGKGKKKEKKERKKERKKENEKIYWLEGRAPRGAQTPQPKM